jgi:photosystem II stability/assembly factor-like uncharacterized protein
MKFRSVLAALGLSLSPMFATAQAVADRCPAQPWTDEVVAKAIGIPMDRLANIKAIRAIDNDDVCTMPKARLDRMLSRFEQPKPSAPGEWARFRAMQQADANGQVKPDGLLRALEKRKEILARGRPGGGSASPTTGAVIGPNTTAPAAGIDSSSWTAIGPGNIGGRIRGMVIHPTATNTIWVGSVSGGMWKSTDAGASWAPVSDFLGNLSISSIVISPTDFNTMYAATGEGFFNVDAVRGAGVFKSTDGGVTWTALASTNPTLNSAWYYVNRIAIHPTNGNILLAATNNGVYRSTDAGVSWTLTTAGNLRYTDADFSPLDGNKAIIAPSSFGGGALSYSNDAGATWTPATWPANMSRVEIAYSRTAGVVYASVDTNVPFTFNTTGSVYRSSDGGATWTLQGSPNHLSTQGWYNNAIWVDPVDSNHVIVAGLDIYRSTNAGVNWTKISSWSQGNSVHADHHVIVSSPLYNGTSNRTIFFGNDGGVYRATDINAVTATNVGWTNLNNGLGVTQFYGGAGHGGTNGRMIGGTQDNGSLVYSGSGTTWTTVFGGDGGAAAIDPTDGNYIYGEYVRLQIHRATNGTGPASYIFTGINDAGSLANFIAPFILDPNTPTTMLAGGRSLWRSTNVKDLAPSWSAILSPTGDGSSSTYTSRIAVAQGNSSLIWVGKNNGTLFKTTNGTVAVPTWNQFGAGVVPSTNVLALLIDKDTPNTVYAGFGGYSNQNLWRTTDGGTNWTSIGTGLPASPVRAIERHPTLANYLYVGTEVGIFTSQDGGATWNTTNDGPANVSVDQLFWYDATTLVAVTHGRGMFRTTVNTTGPYTLTVSKSGAGSGPVSSIPAGISCGSVCSFAFASNTIVTLTATANSGSVFAGWSGACTGTSTCNITMDGAKNVTATFNTATSGYTLSVAKAGAGNGPIVSSPSGISCGSACSKNFATNTIVTLTATPSSGSVFGGWSGACTGTSTCVVTMSQARSVTATFNLATSGQTLTVSKTGTGSGPIVSSPSGISCGSVCTKSFPTNTVVTLTATPNTGSTFGGWSGACTGTSTCVVTMSQARSVTATFNGPPVTYYNLAVGKSGAGSGPVTSSPGGIACGSTCNANFASGTSVTLTAAPNAGSVFGGWSGACSGTALTCVVSMSAARSVTATFNLGYMLSVAKAGTGSGPVSSSPAGISCGSTCSKAYAPNTVVTLTATPNSGSFFTGWSGACTGTSTCVVTMSATRNVTATFTLGNTLTVTKAGTGAGPVTSNPAGISCGSTCSTKFAPGTMVTLTATPNAGSSFGGWTGACLTLSFDCVVNMSAAASVTATFNINSSLGDAVDNQALAWSSLGTTLWWPQSATTHDTVDAAQSGAITHNQSSTLRSTVVGPGALSYWWRVSSEQDWDFLTFVVDGFDQPGAISGESGWAFKSWIIPAGTHTIDWRYSKDGSVSNGSDAGFVDQVVWAPGAVAPGGLTPQMANAPKPAPRVPKK